MYKKLIVICLIFFSFVGNAQELKKVSVQLLWKHQFEFAGFYMAKEKGFYNDIGLDVSLKEFRFGTNISRDVSEGKSDFGVNGSSLILDRINGLDVYLLMPFLQTSPFVLMTKDRDDIKNINDLKNKNIMLTSNQITMASLNAMLKVNNISSKDFFMQEHNFSLENLLNDKIDAMSVFLSNEPFYLLKNNIKYNIFNPSDYGFNFYDNILFTSTNFLNKNPKLVKDFYIATKKGWEYAYNNIDETVKLILKNYNTQNKTYEHLVYEANELKKMSDYGSNNYGKFKPEIINQIVQTYNLLDISKSNVNIKELIYPDALYKEKDINFILIIKIILCIVIVLIGFYYWNRKLSKLNKRILQSQEKISLLLNNAGQGFLVFKDDFKIDNEYSKECEKLLCDNIAFNDISKLLFKDLNKQEFFKNTLLLALKEQNEIKRNSYLSLLPNIILLNKKAIKLDYKVIENKIFMLILTNVTTQKKLENKIKKEQEIFKMIVTIASESTIFYDTINDYDDFINSNITELDLNELYRIIHTFKGTFSQLYMEDIVKTLHSFENILSEKINNFSSQNNNIEELIKNYDLKTVFYETKNIITEILGEEFLNFHNYVKIDVSNIIDLQCKISKMIGEKELASPECKEILCKIQELSKQNLYNLLKPYSSLINTLSNKFNKEIYPLVIEGNKGILVKENIKPFIKSLVHVFRNCLDHGIEMPHERLEKGKKETGTISCYINEIDDKLIISISDDGAGLDIDRIKKKAIEYNINLTSFNDEEIYQMIFYDNFSTKSTISDISGRGIGMSAVKNELNKLNGVVKIITEKNKGTTFEFIIPQNN
ncbi:MAG: ABC transporter substrate-binding protein [Candidatus Altimarinota bacterium]